MNVIVKMWVVRSEGFTSIIDAMLTVAPQERNLGSAIIGLIPQSYRKVLREIVAFSHEDQELKLAVGLAQFHVVAPKRTFLPILFLGRHKDSLGTID